MKKLLSGLCSVVEVLIDLLIVAVVVLFLFSLTPALFVRLIQSIMGLGFVYLLLNRAARRGSNGSSVACGLRTRLSLWSRLAGTAADNGLYCPECGCRGTLSIAVSAYVLQGPKVGVDRFAFEGNADHYTCAHCQAQFVNWSSPWPQLSGITTLLAVIGHRGSDPVCWTVNVIGVGEAIALLGNQLCEEELIERAAAENAAVLDSRADPMGPVSLWRQLSGDRIEFSFRGASAKEALADLQAKMPPQTRARLVGIPASAWMSLSS